MENMKGCAREFPLFGQILRVPAEMDIFNTYRLMFRDLALDYTDQAETAYHANIHDFDSFIEFFMRIYDSKLEPLVKKGGGSADFPGDLDCNLRSLLAAA